MEAILTQTIILEGQLKKIKETYVAFFETKNVFDIVDWSEIIEIMKSWKKTMIAK